MDVVNAELANVYELLGFEQSRLSAKMQGEDPDLGKPS